MNSVEWALGWMAQKAIDSAYPYAGVFVARAVATSNIVKSSTPIVDGVSLVDCDCILLTAQSTASENGLWRVRFTRPWEPVQLILGSYFYVGEGTTNANTLWRMTDIDTITKWTASGDVPTSRQIISGAGLTGGGDLSADRTLNVVANADGSIVANANDIQIGVLATDAQHGTRGGGTQHSNVVAGGAAGFMTGADKTVLNALAVGAVPNTRTLTAGFALGGGGDLSADRTFDVETGSTAVTVCIGNDARLSDARTPLSHATSHKSGGADAIKLDELAAPTDITTLNATTALHGLLRKLDGLTTTFLRGDGTWATPPAGGSGNNGTATLDFGPTPNETASIAVTGQTSITSSANIRAWFQRDATAGNGADEHEEAGSMCPLTCGNIVDGVGFTIYANPIAALGLGSFTTHWNWA